jgi:phosphoribosylformimino-5-aminoimidazole carboxamide ribonucleotide (ProFAR) isomerase
VVDLDAAKGDGRQTETVERIVRAVAGRAACQVGGGLRSTEAVEASLRAGASRVVLGTAILNDPRLAQTVVAAHGPTAIVAALDVRDGQAVGDGWVPGATGRDVAEAIAALADAGVARFVVTSIARDGALRGPDLALLERLVATGRGAIVASGGISSLADLQAVRDIGCEAGIVGRAIYEGVLDLRSAIGVFGTNQPD